MYPALKCLPCRLNYNNSDCAVNHRPYLNSGLRSGIQKTMTSDLPKQYTGCSYFFEDGLCFECLQCGDCCTGDPGTIYVSDSEIESIAEYLQLAVARFRARYLYSYKDSYSIKEDHRGHCLFYKRGCTIYPMRPLQCRTFPFWFGNVRSESRWERIAGQCPGVGRGRRYTQDEIMAIALSTLQI